MSSSVSAPLVWHGRALPADATSAVLWAAAVSVDEVRELLAGVWEELKSESRNPERLLSVCTALNALLLDSSRTAELATRDNIARLFLTADSVIASHIVASAEDAPLDRKNPLSVVKCINNLVMPHQTGQEFFVADGGLARMAALASGFCVSGFDDSAGVSLRMLHRLCGMNKGARAVAQRDAAVRRHVSDAARLLASRLCGALMPASTAAGAVESQHLSSAGAAIYDNMQSLLRLLYALHMDSAPPVPTLESIHGSKGGDDALKHAPVALCASSAGPEDAAVGLEAAERKPECSPSSAGDSSSKAVSSSASGSDAASKSEPAVDAAVSSAPGYVDAPDAEGGVPAALLQALRVEAALESARRLEPCPLHASAASRGLTVDIVNLLFVLPVAWVGVVVSDEAAARYLGDWVVSLARNLGGRGSMPSPTASSNLVVALTVALKAVAARPAIAPLLLRQLTTEPATDPTGDASSAPAVGGAGAASDSGGGAGAGAGAATAPASRKPALHAVHLLQTMDESVKAVADELFWVLTDGNVAALTAAVTFPLAAGILQAKGALQLPPGL